LYQFSNALEACQSTKANVRQKDELANLFRKWLRRDGPFVAIVPANPVDICILEIAIRDAARGFPDAFVDAISSGYLVTNNLARKGSCAQSILLDFFLGATTEGGRVGAFGTNSGAIITKRSVLGDDSWAEWLGANSRSTRQIDRFS
jgi:hypothetical protein